MLCHPNELLICLSVPTSLLAICHAFFGVLLALSYSSPFMQLVSMAPSICYLGTTYPTSLSRHTSLLLPFLHYHPIPAWNIGAIFASLPSISHPQMDNSTFQAWPPSWNTSGRRLRIHLQHALPSWNPLTAQLRKYCPHEGGGLGPFCMPWNPRRCG